MTLLFLFFLKNKSFLSKQKRNRKNRFCSYLCCSLHFSLPFECRHNIWISRLVKKLCLESDAHFEQHNWLPGLFTITTQCCYSLHTMHYSPNPTSIVDFLHACWKYITLLLWPCFSFLFSFTEVGQWAVPAWPWLLYFTHSRCMLIANPVTDSSDTHVFPKSKRRWLREANPVSDKDKPIITSSSKQNITVFFLPRWHQIKRKYQLASAASTSESIDN